MVVFEEIENLHIMILSRKEPTIRLSTLVSREMCLAIDADTLCFNVTETNGYLSMRGIRLTIGAVEEIFQSTGSWVSAIYLLSEGIRSDGTLRCCENIDELFTENLMNRLVPIDREMLYRLSEFDGFPLDMAVEALGMERIRELTKRLMRDNAFITCDEKGVHRFHPLFKDYLAARCPNDEAQKNV